VALRRLLAGGELPPAYRSRWRAAGINDNIEVEVEAELDEG